MANITVTKLPVTVVETAGSPATSIVTITAPMLPNDGRGIHEVTLRVTVGTIKFSVGTAALTGDPAYTSSSAVLKLHISRDKPLHFLAAAQNNAFVIEH